MEPISKMDSIFLTLKAIFCEVAFLLSTNVIFSIMIKTISAKEITDIFDEIIIGKNVKRTCHELVYLGKDYTDIFIDRMKRQNFQKTILNQISINRGFRIPGFLIKNKTAIFGYVFWELFNTKYKRKLWGSVILNKKGDWEYTISAKSKHIIWANTNLIEEINLSTYGLSINDNIKEYE